MYKVFLFLHFNYILGWIRCRLLEVAESCKKGAIIC